MKKILIAGVATLGLGLVSSVGVFAANPAAVVDNLSVSVAESCTFTRTNGTGNYSKTMAASAVDTSFGTSTFKSQCNNGTGYKIKAVFTNIAQSNGDGDAITYGTTTPSASNLGIWTTTYGSGNVENNANMVSTSTMDPAAGSSYTVVYKVSLHNNQAKGTYSGTATYTLSQNAASS